MLKVIVDRKNWVFNIACDCNITKHLLLKIIKGDRYCSNCLKLVIDDEYKCKQEELDKLQKIYNNIIDVKKYGKIKCKCGSGVSDFIFSQNKIHPASGAFCGKCLSDIIINEPPLTREYLSFTSNEMRDFMLNNIKNTYIKVPLDEKKELSLHFRKK